MHPCSDSFQNSHSSGQGALGNTISPMILCYWYSETYLIRRDEVQTLIDDFNSWRGLKIRTSSSDIKHGPLSVFFLHIEAAEFAFSRDLRMIDLVARTNRFERPRITFIVPDGNANGQRFRFAFVGGRSGQCFANFFVFLGNIVGMVRCGVTDRAISEINDMENIFSKWSLIYCQHDIQANIQAAFKEVSPAAKSSYDHFSNIELEQSLIVQMSV